MALTMRLSRGGSKKRPYYKIVVADARAPRDGKFIERLGSYNPLLPKDSAERVQIDADRARHWIASGAQPSDRVARFLDAAGVIERKVRNNLKKGEPGEKAKERAEEKSAKLAAAEEAANAPVEVSVVEEPTATEETSAVVENAPAAEEAVAEKAAAEAGPAAEVPAEVAPASEEVAVVEEAVGEEASVEDVEKPAEA